MTVRASTVESDWGVKQSRELHKHRPILQNIPSRKDLKLRFKQFFQTLSGTHIFITDCAKGWFSVILAPWRKSFISVYFFFSFHNIRTNGLVFYSRWFFITHNLYYLELVWRKNVDYSAEREKNIAAKFELSETES